MTVGSVKERLLTLGISLPEVSAPTASYVSTKQTGTTMLVSGQVPRLNGRLKFVGKVGDSVTPEEATEAARLCALNIVSQLSAALGGDLDRVKACLRLRGFVNASPDFGAHPAVINGASDLIVAVFGERGRHARTAIGVGSLPNNVAVEVDADFEIETEHSCNETGDYRAQ